MATGFGRYTPGQGFQSVAPGSSSVGGPLGTAINKGGGGGSSGNSYQEQQAQEAARQAELTRQAQEKAAEQKAKEEAAKEAAAKQAAQEQFKRDVIIQKIRQGQMEGLKIDVSNRIVSTQTGRAVGVSSIQAQLRAEQAAVKKQELANNNQINAKPISEVVSVKEPSWTSKKIYAAGRQIEKDKFSIKTQTLGIIAGAGASVISSAKFGKSLVTNPVKTTKEVGTGLKNVGTRLKTGEFFPEAGAVLKSNPSLAIGYVGAEIATGYATGAAATKTVKTALPTLAKLDIPLTEGTKTIKILGYETKGGRAAGIGYYKPESTLLKSKIGLGIPNIRNELNLLPDTTEIKIASALETKSIQKSLASNIVGTTQRAQEFIPTAQTILRKTAKGKSRFIDEANLFAATQRLPKEGVKTFLDISKEKGGILFGSKSRAAQLSPEYKIGGEKFRLDKVPRDIELRFDKLDDTGLKEVTDISITRLKKLGTIEQGGVKFELGTAREISDTPFAIEAKVGGKWEKVAELKGAGASVEGEKVSEYVLGFKKTGKTIKLAGFEATPLREELRAVTQGVARVRKSKESGLLDIFPSPKREKDIASVSVSARTLEMSRKIPSFKLRRAIEKFESFYPKDLLLQQVKKIDDVSTKQIIADFSGKSSPYKFSNTFNQKNAYGITGFTIKTNQPSPSYYKSKTETSYYKSVSPSPKELKTFSPSPYFIKSPRSSPSPSYSPRTSPSPTLSPKTISPFLSPSPSPSPKTSPSPYTSPYKSASPSPFPSPYSQPKIKPFKETKVFDFKLPKGSGGSKAKGLFGVEIRRKGKFFNVGTSKTLGGALELGRSKVSKTLARSFRLTGGSGKGLALPQGFRKAKKEKNVFVEKSQFALSTSGEKLEIAEFRKSKGGMF